MPRNSKPVISFDLNEQVTTEMYLGEAYPDYGLPQSALIRLDAKRDAASLHFYSPEQMETLADKLRDHADVLRVAQSDALDRAAAREVNGLRPPALVTEQVTSLTDPHFLTAGEVA